MKQPIFLEDSDPEALILEFLEELLCRQELISKKVCHMYLMQDEESIPQLMRDRWTTWVNQVPVLGFNSGKYNINMIKEYFVRVVADPDDVNVAKKDNSYMFLSTPKLKFLDVHNYLAPGLDYDGWFKVNSCSLEKLKFPYKWLDSYEKLSHVGPASYEVFHLHIKGKNLLSPQDYEEFVKEFHARGCATMMDWLQEYNLAEVIPFIQAVDEERERYYPDEIDMLRDVVSIKGISMTYVLNNALESQKPGKPELYAPGQPCMHTCKGDGCCGSGCLDCKHVRIECELCPKNNAYHLLHKGMIGGPSIVFCRYAEVGKTQIRGGTKPCKSIVGFDANSLYLYCSGQEMPCGKERYIEDPTASVQELCNRVMTDDLFGFLEVDICVPGKLREKFSEFSPLLMIDSIPESLVPTQMKEYQERTDRKTFPGTKKLLGVLQAERILLNTSLLKWYLSHGLIVAKVHRYLEYTSGRPFSWFPEEMSGKRHDWGNDPALKQLGDTFKLKGNSFYGKMIENLAKHIKTSFTHREKLADMAFVPPSSKIWKK